MSKASQIRRIIAKVMRFYGMSLQEVRRIKFSDLVWIADEIEQLEANELLCSIIANSFPYYDEKEQGRIIRNLDPKDDEFTKKRKELSSFRFEQLKNQLNG